MSSAARRCNADDVRHALDDPRTLAEGLGLEIVGRQSRGVFVICPHHNGDSCSVSLGPDGTVRFHCFGCGESGDALALVAAVHGLSTRGSDFARVLEIAAGIVGVSPTVSGLQSPPRPVRIVPPEEQPLDAATWERIAAHFDPIEKHPDVLAYALRRLPGADVSGLRAFPASTHALHECRNRIVEDVGLDAWQRSGLAYGNGFVWDEHRLCFLYRNELGRVTTVQRRLIRPARDEQEKKRSHVFPRNHGARTPYGFERVAGMSAGAAVAFTESALDAIALRTMAARDGREWCVLGVPGVGAWRGSMANAARGRVAIVATDADDAGDKAAEVMARDLRIAGALSVKRARPQGAKDWAEVLARGAT